MRDRKPSGHFVIVISVLAYLTLGVPAQAESGPEDLWTPAVLAKIRKTGTLNPQIVPRAGYAEVFFDSENDARWADSEPPYAVHHGDTVRIHGYLASPAAGGPYPALVIGHGHHGRGSADLARALAAFGYVVLSIDGPNAGLSTGGPRDTEQAWISVERKVNQPAPEVSYLYHYAYAGMRALTLLEALADVPLNPFRIDADRLGVAGASMGGQFTYYINGVDDRVKAAIAIAVAGDWGNILTYDAAWLYHGLYYYTRDGLRSGVDALNTISDVCTDPTIQTFVDHFDPIAYAPTQHGPLLTILGTHDQYFTAPAINTTYDRVQSAGSSDRFEKRILLAPDGKHGVIDSANPFGALLALFGTIDRWLQYSFGSGPAPLETPAIQFGVLDDWMMFRVTARNGETPTTSGWLSVASQLDSTPEFACDFVSVPLVRFGADYYGFVRTGQAAPCGPPVTPDNVVYFASIGDSAGYTVSSKLYYRADEMRFGSGFVPRIEHWRGDDFPTPPPPVCQVAR